MSSHLPDPRTHHPRSPGRLSGPLVCAAIGVLYLLSFGPACWMYMRGPWTDDSVLEIVYQPLIQIWQHSSDPLHRWILNYVNAGTGSKQLIIHHEGELGYYTPS